MSMTVRFQRPTGDGPVLLVHGGAGPRSPELATADLDRYHDGLKAALAAGSAVLTAGGAALDAVCAAVTALEDNPLFNAGRGAALTAAGAAELDSAVMTGDGRAGAIAACTHLRNPVLGARAVMERTRHVLLFNPDRAVTDGWGLESVDPGYFVTQRRQDQLARILKGRETAAKHGTVGAVALDRAGAVACATSTGGIAGQDQGRVGDTPLIGAGSFAAADSVAISCTGEGEAYIRSVVAHDVAARIRYGGHDLLDAVAATYAEALDAHGATGGSIALTPSGRAAIVHNSAAMFAGFWDETSEQTFV